MLIYQIDILILAFAGITKRLVYYHPRLNAELPYIENPKLFGFLSICVLNQECYILVRYHKNIEDLEEFRPVLQHLKSHRGLDFSGNCPSLVKRRIHKRLAATNCADIYEYLEYLKNNADEFDYLLDVLAINVSRFFREPLIFEYIGHKVLPALGYEKTVAQNHVLRVWSAGCAAGEEPYSMAILIREFVETEQLNLSINIFATDIDERALQKAQKGIYEFDSVQNIRYGLLKKYFSIDHGKYLIVPKIKNMVTFSFFDMVDEKGFAPPESIFGNFDIVLCMNILIYFGQQYQSRIVEKLYRSLARGGFLILGHAEKLPEIYKRFFIRCTDCASIYRKK